MKEYLFYTSPHCLITDWADKTFVNPFDIHKNAFEIFKKCPGLKNEVKEIFKSFNSQGIESIFQNLPYTANLDDEKMIKRVKTNLKNEINKSKKDEDVLLKYLWVKEFLNWILCDNKGKLDFRYFLT